MFDFGTSTGQVLYRNHTDIGTSGGQALVPINKPIQTIENFENINKRQILENSNSEKQENRTVSVPYKDNLKTNVDKNYDEPL